MPIARLELLPEKPAVFKGRLNSVLVAFRRLASFQVDPMPNGEP